MCLLETFIEDHSMLDGHFSSFKLFFKKAVKLSGPGRCSGGVVVLVKKSLCKYITVKEIVHSFDHIIGLKFSNIRSQAGQNDIIFISSYIPPYSSPYYDVSLFNNGINMLEQCIFDFKVGHPNCDLIIAADLNSRISSTQPLSECERASMFVDGINMFTNNDNIDVYLRSSQDKETNTYGRRLIELCACFDLVVMNGFCMSDLSGSFTNISPHGNSVVDYFLVSENLLINHIDMKVDERIESWHMPIILSFKCLQNSKPVAEKIVLGEKFVWDSEKTGSFYERLFSTDTLSAIDTLFQSTCENVEEAICLFSELLKNASECMKKTVKVGYLRPKASWFDSSCRDFKRRVKASLRKYRRYRNELSKIEYVKIRKEYKKFLKEK